MLLSLYGGCGNGEDASNGVSSNHCFSLDSTNPCFDENINGSSVVVDDRTAEEIVNEKRNEQGFLSDLEYVHLIKSYNPSIKDFECNESLSESELVIKNSIDWSSFRNSCYFSQFSIPQNIDFSKQSILISIQDTRNGGTGTDIISILDFSNEIVAVIKDHETRDPEDFLQFIFHIISIPQVDNKPVDFIRVKDTEANICFSNESENPCFSHDTATTIITDKTIDQVINDMADQEGFVRNLQINIVEEHGPFVGPPESFLNPDCIAAIGQSEGIIDNKADWDNFRLSCLSLSGFRLRNSKDINFNKEIVLFSLQDTDGLGTTIDAVQEFNTEIQVVIRDDISDSELPILVFPSSVVILTNTDLPINFTRVTNQSGINTIDGCTAKKVFPVLPECLADEIVSGAFSDCQCVGDSSGSFLMEFTFIVNGAATPFIFFDGEFSNSFAIENLDCNNISLSNHSPPLGMLQNLNVPGPGTLNFTKIIQEDAESVECNCIDSPCASIPVKTNHQ